MEDEKRHEGLGGQMPTSVEVRLPLCPLFNPTSSQQRARCHEPDGNIPVWSCQTFLVVHQPDLQNHVHDIYLWPESSMPKNLNCLSTEMASVYLKVHISI